MIHHVRPTFLGLLKLECKLTCAQPCVSSGLSFHNFIGLKLLLHCWMLTFLRPTLDLTRSRWVAPPLHRFPVTIRPDFVPLRPSAGAIPCLHQHDLWPVSQTSQQLWRNSNSDQPITMPTYQQHTSSHGHAATNRAPQRVWTSTAELQVCILRAYSLHILISFYCFVLNCTLHNTAEKKKTIYRRTDYASMSQTKFGQLYFCTHVLGSAVLSGLVGILVFTCSVVFIPRLPFYFSGCGFFLSPPGSSAYPFPHISPTQLDIHTFSSSFYSASGIT